MSFGTHILFIALAVLGIFFFAGTEMAFISADKLNLNLQRKQRRYSSKILGKFIDRPYEFIASNILGFTLAVVLYSLLISQLIQPYLTTLVERIGYGNAVLLLLLSLLLDVVVATLIILVVMELIPKAIFKRRANSVLHFLAFPIHLFYVALYPIMRLLISVSEFMLKYLFNLRIREDREPFDRIDLEHFVRYSLNGTEGLDEDRNRTLFENALQLMSVKVRKCMVPRNEIVAIAHSASPKQLIETFASSRLTRILVYKDSIDHIVGYVHHIDLNKQATTIDEILHAIPAVPETMSLINLLELLNNQRKSIAWVIDEYGGTAGIITMEDVLEQLFGDIQEDHKTSALTESRLSENEYLLSGRLELAYLRSKYGMPFPKQPNVDTLSGFIVEHLGNIPPQKERVIINNFEFDILLVTKTKVETVKMKILS